MNRPFLSTLVILTAFALEGLAFRAGGRAAIEYAAPRVSTSFHYVAAVR
jgi:hypothetical protein